MQSSDPFSSSNIYNGGRGQKSQEFCDTSFSLSKGCEKVTIMSLLRSNKNFQSSSQKKETARIKLIKVNLQVNFFIFNGPYERFLLFIDIVILNRLYRCLSMIISTFLSSLYNVSLFLHFSQQIGHHSKRLCEWDRSSRSGCRKDSHANN